MSEDDSDIKSDLKEIKRDINVVHVTLARAESKIQSIETTIQEVKQELKEDFVSTESFNPVRNFVYGTIALIASGFLAAVLFLISWRGD